MLTAMIVAVSVLALIDAVSTERALALGYRERNAVLARLLGSRPDLPTAIAWRAAVVVGLAWFGMPWYGWAMLIPPQLYAVAHNLRVVR